MSGSDEAAPSRFRFNREIRLGDVLVLIGVTLGVTNALQKNEMRIENLEKGRGDQIVENKELRSSIQAVNLEIRAEMRDQGTAIRRIEDKINRARM